ncbi:hypothetical protein GCK32_015131 [Trichostrongylus colubriformis]|uniref:Retrotransposon gag domain-containing protein n=1 Tax=Trichostrongylus colubriformis TaxID=6319 RepID=A0AAN8G399_TRICO
MGAKPPKEDMSEDEMDVEDQVRDSLDPRGAGPPPLVEWAAIRRACDEALDGQIRNLAESKRTAILDAVEAAVVAVRAEAEEAFRGVSELKHVLMETGLYVAHLRLILRDAETKLGLIEALAGELGCGRTHLVRAVVNLKEERSRLMAQISVLQDQLDQNKTETQQRPCGEKQGKNYSRRRLGERLMASIEVKDEFIQEDGVHQHDEAQRKDGARNARLDWQGRSADGSTRRFRFERTSESETSSDSEKYMKNGPPSNANASPSDSWGVFKAMWKAQTAASVERYTGKNSLSDFLRGFEIKYPRESWSNRERRDILVTLLDGPAKMLFSNAPKRIQEGSFEDMIEALERARRDPCKKLKKVEEWDRLRKRENETVEEFCYKMERISREIHGDSDRDFLLG